MTTRARLVPGHKLTFTTPGDNPPVEHTPERVWLLKRHGNALLGYAVVAIGDRLTAIEYDYDEHTWSQITQWHVGLEPSEIADTWVKPEVRV